MDLIARMMVAAIPGYMVGLEADICCLASARPRSSCCCSWRNASKVGPRALETTGNRSRAWGTRVAPNVQPLNLCQKDLLISDVIRTNELQVWFIAEHLAR